MNIRSTLLGGAALAAAAFAFTPALAEDTAAGSINGGYAYADGSGSSVDVWGVGGTFTAPFNDNWGFQGNAQYTSVDSSSFTEVGASLYYSMPTGRIGATVGYVDGSSGGISGGDLTYGAFGEFYGENVTFGVKGGVLDESGGNITYLGARLTGYVGANWAITGQITYFDLASSTTNAKLEAEYKFNNSPVSVALSYARLSQSGSDANIFGITLRAYFGGGDSLRDAQRAGKSEGFVGSPGVGTLF